jgi:hypothetical protein
MRVEIRPLYRNGALHSQRSTEAARQGDLRVGEHRDTRLGRAVTLARLVDPAREEADVLPELLDARLLWMREGEMRITGLQRGETADFAQTWHVRVL